MATAPRKPAGSRAKKPWVALSVLEATRRELGQELCSTSLGAAALAVAKSLDDSGSSPTAKAALARSLDDLIRTLQEKKAAEPAGDKLDELGARRASRRRVPAT